MSTVFMKPKIPLAVKVLQVFPGKILCENGIQPREIKLRITASHLGKVNLSKNLPRQIYNGKDLLPWCE